MAAKFTITGVKEIERAFKVLPAVTAKKVIRPALRAGAKIVAADVKRRVPVRSGLLRDSIKVRSARARRKGRLGIGVVIGKGDFQGETFYGAFQEYGWSEQPGKGFMRGALDAKAEEAANVAAKMITEGIEREAAKLA